MQQPGLTLAFVEKGKALPDGFRHLIEEAGQAIAGLVDAHGQPYRRESVSTGPWT
jgi:hypothetical protein